MRSVSKKTGVSKKAARDRQILAKAKRENGGEKPLTEATSPPSTHIHLGTFPNGDRVCIFNWEVIERLDKVLASAAESAIEAAPREAPPLYGRVGAQAAVDACRAIREVREAFATAMTGAL